MNDLTYYLTGRFARFCFFPTTLPLQFTSTLADVIIFFVLFAVVYFIIEDS